MKKSRSLEVIQLYSNLIRNMMENDVVKLLVDDDDENLFLGFIAYEPKTKVLDYVYLIFAMRGIGLADKLIKDVLGDGDLTCSHSNGRLPKNFKFNPFTLTERNYK